MRIFISLKTTPYEDELFKILCDLKKKIRGDIKWVSKDNLHVTTKFLGEVEESFLQEIFRIVKETVKISKPFSFEIKGISGFPKKDFARVLFFSIVDFDKNIENIMKILDKDFEKYHFKREESYVPHITFGRCRRNYINLNEYKFEDFDFVVNALGLTVYESILMSNGPIYKEIETFNFKD
ncbi:RNA 2',3'-cyclic phosphodiesterase [Caldisericum exile]|uniref:RNA 2',3'-cyclic phosphodiesterase n=1 Tax=Caldisericum exile (strain DSM 21853 / NBRC 104410 / AZM16c01) TaxID=511051 RepID=A0A7U6JFV1_CALEA|nr:RNA 2',3'-cyclic phosphodiesterase [Caldisericum exile]BAL80854.1 2',5' RNA ligase family protein [Caldisericum exile AZM16c01]